MAKRTDTASRLIGATRDAIYHAMVDPEALMAWLPPAGMSGRALLFEPWEGGRYRIELSYEPEEGGAVGKTSARTDISSGRFLALIPDERVVQTAEFESDDPAFAGTMTLTWALEPKRGGSLVIVTAEDVPPGISAEDHEAGLASSLENLAGFVETRRRSQESELAATDGMEGPFYHGTRAELKRGDLIEAGFSSNYGQRKQASWVYLTATLDAAIWGAELAAGEGKERIYVVEPTGPIIDDPNLTDKKFPGNPTRSYRSLDALRVIGEVAEWQGHSAEQLLAMKDNLERLKAQGIEAID